MVGGSLKNFKPKIIYLFESIQLETSKTFSSMISPRLNIMPFGEAYWTFLRTSFEPLIIVFSNKNLL